MTPLAKWSAQFHAVQVQHRIGSATKTEEGGNRQLKARRDFSCVRTRSHRSDGRALAIRFQRGINIKDGH
ncbi:hypothetical protein SCP_0402050 [Sparassis crispa]|uniref:Transposase n=1 Tax=Sparassis crispa TaxID=139825 RepID=A0A401GI32_9APHY|nr:hypothetical protein SCP_0402050 [Sparassis crispa]GBE81832.1 hypothetical protein SCP_0402050 [Sparassis crispa]